MICGFETADEIAQCVVIAREWLATARPWIEFGLSLLGVGTIGLLAVLTWILKKQRRDIEGLQSTAEALRSASKRAIEAQGIAEGKLARSEQNLARALATLAAIANCYLGEERTYKSKAEILKAITNRQLQDALQVSRDRRIAKIAV